MIVELDLLKFTYLTGLYMVFNGHYYMIARVVFLLIDQFFFFLDFDMLPVKSERHKLIGWHI